MSVVHDDNQSLRLACDRCRTQKLKCAQKEHHTTSCERCIRAKVKCKFSPRARAARPLKHLKRGSPEVDRGAREQEITVDDIATASLTSLHSVAEHSVSTCYCSSDWAQCMCSGRSNIDTEELDGLFFDGNPLVPYKNACSTEPSLFPDLPVSHSTYMSSDYDTQYILELPTSELPQETSALDLSLTPSAIHCEVSDAVLVSAISGSQNDGDDSIHKLSALAVDAHHQLRVLNNGPWTTERDLQKDDQMKTYPIGDILFLSQQFINQLKHISLNASGIDVETPTALVILYCCVSLLRVYCVVFSDLHKYLLVVSTLKTHASMSEVSPGLSLGELQPRNMECKRTHTAVHMLLDKLGSIEEILGFPSDLRCVHSDADSDTEYGISTTKFDNSGLRSNDEASKGGEVLDSDSSGSGRTSDKPMSAGGLVDVILIEAMLGKEALNGPGSGVGLILLRKNIE